MEKFRQMVGNVLVSVDKPKGKGRPYLVLVTCNGMIIEYAGETQSRKQAIEMAKQKVKEYSLASKRTKRLLGV